MVSPFGYTGASRSGLFNQQQQPNNFSGWDDRLSKIEKGIAGLTDQFNSFQTPGDVAPEYTGNAAPEPLEQSANAPEPLGGIESLVAPPAPMAPMGGQAMGQAQQGNNYGTPSFSYHQLDPVRDAEQIASQGPGFDMMNAPSQLFGQGSWSPLGRHRPIMPGDPNFNPLSAEQFASQKDLWGRRKDYSDFSSMASDVTGIGGGIGGLRRKMSGSDPRFGHAYEAWQDYAAGYGGSDPSQGMENWMQDYNFDLAPERPQFQIEPGSGQGGFQSAMSDYTQSIQGYESSPEYLEWKQRQEARGPLSESTTQAMGGGVRPMGGPPDINPFISMGMGAGQDPTYESYMEMVNKAKEGYRPQQPFGIKPLQPSGGGIYQQNIGPLSQGLGAGISGLAAYQGKQALQGPVQQQIKQSMGAGV